MPVVTLKRSSGDVVVSVPEGRDLLSTALDAGLPLASSCSGEGSCKACVVAVVEGAAHLRPCDERETAALDKVRAEPGSRLACAARVLGDVVITAPYW